MFGAGDKITITFILFAELRRAGDKASSIPAAADHGAAASPTAAATSAATVHGDAAPFAAATTPARGVTAPVAAVAACGAPTVARQQLLQHHSQVQCTYITEFSGHIPFLFMIQGQTDVLMRNYQCD